MPFLFRCDETFLLKVGEVMPDRDGIDTHRLGDFIDGDFGMTEQGLQNLVFRAFHGREYNRLPQYCQYTRKIS